MPTPIAIPRDFRRHYKNIVECRRCDRLIPYCQEIARTKRRAYRDDHYWGGPVPAFGDPNAELWILGLAPGAHGANRTGRMFTGDSSGLWVYRALHEFGFASKAESRWHNDDLVLRNAYISAVIRCAPPQNKPEKREVDACEPFLDKEFKILKSNRLILATGSIAFSAACRLLKRQGIEVPREVVFRHGAYYDLGERALLASYHPSQQNTNTGRLTRRMWNQVFRKARKVLAS